MYPTAMQHSNPLYKVTEQTKKAAQLRADKVSCIVNEHTKRCQEVLHEELSRHTCPNIKPFVFEVDLDRHLGWIKGNKGYFSKANRKQNAEAWVNSKKAVQFSEGLFPDIFIRVQKYAYEVAQVLASGEGSGESAELLAHYLAFQYFQQILLATYSSGSGAGSRPLINDASFERRCNMTRFLNQCLGITDKKAFYSKEIYVSRFQKLSLVFWTRYTQKLNRGSPKPSVLPPQLYWDAPKRSMASTHEEEDFMPSVNTTSDEYPPEIEPDVTAMDEDDEDMRDSHMHEVNANYQGGWHSSSASNSTSSLPYNNTTPPQENAVLKKYIDEYKQAFATMSSKINQLESALHDSNNQIQSLRQMNESYKHHCQYYSGRNNQLEAKLNKFRGVYQRFSDVFSDFGSLCEESRSTLPPLQQQQQQQQHTQANFNPASMDLTQFYRAPTDNITFQ